MRLTCPNCGATYEVENWLVPAAGSHVQCSACHTRWFARPPHPEPERLSEEQIIARLETRTQRPRLATAQGEAQPVVIPPAAPPAVAPPAVAPDVVAPDVVQTVDARKSRPEDGRRGELLHLASTPLRPRPGAGAGSAPSTRNEAPAKRPRGRFGSGFALAVALAAAGLAMYLAADRLRTAAPALAPALDGYASLVDAARDGIEAGLGPLRDRATAAIAGA